MEAWRTLQFLPSAYTTPSHGIFQQGYLGSLLPEPLWCLPHPVPSISVTTGDFHLLQTHSPSTERFEKVLFSFILGASAYAIFTAKSSALCFAWMRRVTQDLNNVSSQFYEIAENLIFELVLTFFDLRIMLFHGLDRIS